ncbi:hypothetical protein KBD45_01115 [Candidatus Dojkabacteria bacterium]|nr:hypothetical protein [Candidatus Dojkabacteria bacterium]
MKIYVTHSTGYDFKTELYEPIMASEIYKLHQITLPHLTKEFINSKEVIFESDLILAEVSFPSTGQGIELGWAENLGKKVICFYKSGSKYSSALNVVSSVFLEYNSNEEMVNKLLTAIK